MDYNYTIPWEALEKARNYYNENLLNCETSEFEWFRDIYGIDWESRYIRIVDEKKFMMFLLEWA